MKILTSLLVLIALALAVLFWAKPPQAPEPRAVEGLPWQVEVLDDGGSRVFGLTLGRDTLGDVLSRLGPDMELAIIVAGDGPESLEMYYSRYTAGVLTGKLVLSGELDAVTLAGMRERSGLPRYLCMICVIPAHAGIQIPRRSMNSGIRRNDDDGIDAAKS
ncbi:MAG: hypothetical protein LC646_09785 [Xanthomonadaceae bacterium]|nr:hypothetical protein [Xanthomonadaceae bacterium]